MRLASRNVGGVEPVFESLVPELLSVTPDIVILQDAAGGHPLLATAFKDWHRSQAGEFYVASRFPLRHVAHFRSAQFDRNAAAAFEIVHPDGKFLLVSVRLTAPQGELDILAPGKLISSAARAEVTAHVRQRAAEAADLRAFIEEHRREMPLVIAGDFGMPASCSAFRECAAGLRNAFDAGGRGYGYTAPCRAARFWPGDTPWTRVDHCLTSADWQIERCWTGDGDGADHRMIGAVLHW
jgi:endonuclease/exonuclease/phosphatase family metal-dependent hydrolase